ncbi:MAG: pyruvate,orthophosphate dikinase, partial [Planctomycetota bacterium]
MTQPSFEGSTPSRPELSPLPKNPPIFAFGDGRADGDREMKDLLGGKGANLAEMSNLGLPVPPGFTITTEVCDHFRRTKGGYPKEFEQELATAMSSLESSLGKRFGDVKDPLLVSVRSGARVSMPGMMDTILNLGLNEQTVIGLAEKSGNPRFAWDAYRRFVQMYGEVVMGVGEGDERSPYTLMLDELKSERGVENDTLLSAKDLLELTRRFKALTKERSGEEFPEDPMHQLWGAIAAVFRSWNNERAVTYRQMHDFSDEWGTAVSVVAMVFGNLGETSGTGVAFTRDPSTGEKKFYGEYLLNAQGEDVVAGLRTPQAIDGLRETLPAAWEELLNIQEKLEDHFGDMQDLEFTIQEGQLYMLQCRAGKRTGFAALRIASEMVGEGRIDTAEAVRRVPPDAIDQVLQPVFADRELAQARELGRYLCKGLNAGPGAATGRIAFSSQRAQEIAAGGETVVLVRIETSPEDIKGMQASVGILTARGGMTSHAALVARQMGKVCIAGAEELIIDYAHARMDIAGKTLREGDWLSLDGTKGEVYEGLINTVPSEVHAAIFGTDDRAIKARDSQLYKAYQNVLSWADQHRRMRVRTNADQPDQCETAIRLGAEGIGLCRTEHMFFGEEKIGAMRAMILAENSAARERALTKLLPLQRADFEGVFRAMAGRPVTIRTLDPPLHEFLPHGAEATVKLAAQLGVTIETIEEKVEQLSEQNPMLGHRGCRLGISQPEITRMQARAIFEAACIVKLEGGPFPQPEIMI